MTAQCPTTGRSGDCPWLTLEHSRRARFAGWLTAAAVVGGAALGLGLLASLAAPAPQPFAVGLAQTPRPQLPEIAALPEPPPLAEPEAPVTPTAQPDAPAPLATTPRLAAADPVPDMLPLAPAPQAATEAATEAAPRAPEKPEPQKVEPKKPAPKKLADKAPAPSKVAPKAPPQVATAQSGKAAGSADPKAWAASVVKKIRKTSRAKASAGRGTVQIGFTVAQDGSLSGVRVLESSGNAQLDEIGLDHIRRAAPFAAPPQGKAVNLAFSFEQR